MYPKEVVSRFGEIISVQLIYMEDFRQGGEGKKLF
jgi:hypothetical protein